MLRYVREVSAGLRRVTGRQALGTELELVEPILIRYSRDDDRAALERLAALDGRTLANGAFLLAEVANSWRPRRSISTRNP